VVIVTGPEEHGETDSGRAPFDADAFAGALARCGAEWVAARLHPYVRPERRARIEAVLAARVASVQVAIEDPQDPHNIAAIVRTAEALGAGVVHAIGAPAWDVYSPRVTRGAVRWADVRVHPRWTAFTGAVGSGVRLAAACVQPGDGVLELERLPVDRPVCLVFGSEGPGLSVQALEACELRFTIPMVGMMESLNVSVAAAIALSSALARRRALLGGAGDLEPGRRDALRAEWYAKSVDGRLVRALLTEARAS
jgi:tRNA (guanosine-2'-O-)-methyltransferase